LVYREKKGHCPNFFSKLHPKLICKIDSRSDLTNLGEAGRGRGDLANEAPGAAAKLVQLDDLDPDSSEDATNATKIFVSGVNVTRTGGSGGKVVAFCPARCQCDITHNNQLQVCTILKSDGDRHCACQ
jgi:hypothetical protein